MNHTRLSITTGNWKTVNHVNSEKLPPRPPLTKYFNKTTVFIRSFRLIAARDLVSPSHPSKNAHRNFQNKDFTRKLPDWGGVRLRYLPIFLLPQLPCLGFSFEPEQLKHLP